MTLLTLDMMPRIYPPETGSKFSQNLHDWCMRHFRANKGDRYNLEVHSHTNEDGTFLYVGWVFDGEGSAWASRSSVSASSGRICWAEGCTPSPSLIGSRLWSVVCDGRRAKIWSYAFKTEPVPDFWDRYLVIGKCAIDTAHSFYDERWEQKGEKRRVCKWCGHAQVRETYTVVKERWVAATRPEVLEETDGPPLDLSRPAEEARS